MSHMQLEEGTVLKNPEEVHQGAATYFQNFLTSVSKVEQMDLSYLLSKVVFDEANIELCKDLLEDEVKEAVFSIPIQSSPEPDGFGSYFLHLMLGLCESGCCGGR